MNELHHVGEDLALTFPFTGLVALVTVASEWCEGEDFDRAVLPQFLHAFSKLAVLGHGFRLLSVLVIRRVRTEVKVLY